MAGGGLQFSRNSTLPPHGLVWCGADPGKLELQPVPSGRTTSNKELILCAALLILVLATSAFGCATGWRSEPGTFCFRQSSREACAGKKPNTRAGGWSACSHT